MQWSAAPVTLSGLQFSLDDILSVIALYLLNLLAEGKVKATIEDQHLESINDIFDRMKAGKINGRIVLDIAEHAAHSHHQLAAAHA